MVCDQCGTVRCLADGEVQQGGVPGVNILRFWEGWGYAFPVIRCLTSSVC